MELLSDIHQQTYRAMEEMQRKGKTKAIGVSNFSRAEIEHLLEGATITPAVHQLELHPWLQQRAFVGFLKSKGIHITQYSTLGNQNEFYSQGSGEAQPRLLDDPVLSQIGKKYKKTNAQVALGKNSTHTTPCSMPSKSTPWLTRPKKAWGIAQGHSVLVKSKTPQRIEENSQSDFLLSDEDLAMIAAINKDRRFNDSSKDFGYDFFADLDDKQR
jgi:diketogulonate reductase-like aldo/keto reductase